jgi:hypothetical protein
MDAKTREQWRWKFYRLALHLNVVILCIAITVMAALIAPDQYRIPLVAILIVLDISLSYTFLWNYHATKSWLDEHGTSPGEKQEEQE